MDTTSLENLLQAAAVDQLIGYEGNQTAQNLLQDVQGGQNKYPAYLEDMSNSNNQDAASFGDNLINDGNFNEYDTYLDMKPDIALLKQKLESQTETQQQQKIGYEEFAQVPSPCASVSSLSNPPSPYHNQPSPAYNPPSPYSNTSAGSPYNSTSGSPYNDNNAPLSPYSAPASPYGSQQGSPAQFNQQQQQQPQQAVDNFNNQQQQGQWWMQQEQRMMQEQEWCMSNKFLAPQMTQLKQNVDRKSTRLNSVTQ